MNSMHPGRGRAIEALESRIAPASTHQAFDLTTLNGTNGFVIDNTTTGAFGIGREIAHGDFNGDGIPDLLIGAYDQNPGGAAYVIFGSKTAPFPAVLNTASLNGTNGFIIKKSTSGDLGCAVAAGDLNGDGIDDIIVGDYSGGPPIQGGTAPNSSGLVYVIYGTRGGFPQSIDVATTVLDGSNGFTLHGHSPKDAAGSALAVADVNGDGAKDLIIGAEGANRPDPNSAPADGAVYVVFGHAAGGAAFAPSIDLEQLNGNGFKINGPHVAGKTSAFGEAVASVGDINHDGIDDFAAGASGTAYVFLGKTGLNAADIKTLNGSNGFTVAGFNEAELGDGIAGGGDINGDGIADLVVGDYGGPLHGASHTYVIFGTNQTAFPAHITAGLLNGRNGFTLLDPAGVDHEFGVAVSLAGDINNDGIADLLVGANGVNHGIGAAYLVYGHKGAFPKVFDVSKMIDGCNGFAINGVDSGGSLGVDVSTGVDLNGDGINDIVVGAYNAGTQSEGKTYVIYGKTDPHVNVISAHEVQYYDEQGDLATVLVSKGTLDCDQFTLVPQGKGFHLQKIDLTEAQFSGASLLMYATKVQGGTGDGQASVDDIDATGQSLGAILVRGSLEKIDAGSGAMDAHGHPIAGLRELVVNELGEKLAVTGSGAEYHSTIHGPLGALIDYHDARSVFLEVTGSGAGIGSVYLGGNLDGSAAVSPTEGLIRADADIGAVTIRGSMIGGADFSGVETGGKLGRVLVYGDISSADPAKPVTISALGHLGATTSANAVALTLLAVGGNVSDARILAGYDTSLAPKNTDAGIGSVLVFKNWAESSIAAGVIDTSIAGDTTSPPDGLGRNDTLIPGDTTPALLARIASITIRGTATGSASPSTDFYGLTAQQLGALTIGSKRFALTHGPDDISLDPANGNFHAVDFA